LPDIDTLLQEWNSDVEEVIGEDKFLPSDVDCDLLCYIDVACGKKSFLVHFIILRLYDDIY
jgi:hypothetical protein